MSHFAHIDYPTRHPGVVRIERAARFFSKSHAAHFVIAALAVIGSPVRRLGAAVAAGMDKRAEARRQAREDDKLWNLALTDARVMADLSRAMSSAAPADIKRYY
jgi:hypothetical protein